MTSVRGGPTRQVERGISNRCEFRLPTIHESSQIPAHQEWNLRRQTSVEDHTAARVAPPLHHRLSRLHRLRCKPARGRHFATGARGPIPAVAGSAENGIAFPGRGSGCRADHAGRFAPFHFAGSSPADTPAVHRIHSASATGFTSGAGQP